MRPLHERVAKLRPRLPSASWVRPESQHLTFAFLGEQEEALVERLAPLLESSLAREEKFEARLRGCGFFPNVRRARVGWVGVEPHERFEAVARAVRSAVEAVGVTLDRADFRAHLTLMRIRDAWPPLAVQTFQAGLGDFVSEPFVLNEVTLYSSKLNPSGAIHTPLRRFALA